MIEYILNALFFRLWSISKTILKRYMRIAGLDSKMNTIAKNNLRKKWNNSRRKGNSRLKRLRYVDKKSQRSKKITRIQMYDSILIRKDKSCKISFSHINLLLKIYYFIVSMQWPKNFYAIWNVYVRNSLAIYSICLALDLLLKG